MYSIDSTLKKLITQSVFGRCSSRDNTEAMYFSGPGSELASNRVGTFRNYFRMTKPEFQYVLCAIQEDIEKFPTTATPISAKERLMVTLRYLATGQSLTSLHYDWKISVASLSSIIIEVCEAILSNLRNRFLATPQTENEWRQIAAGLTRWNYPNCIGCIDGKHIAMNKPWQAGSQYHNYKGFESIVLMAVCDSNYRFTYVECGAEGRTSDGGVFRSSKLFQKIENGTINFPPPAIPELGTQLLPHVIVGDEAFPLKNYLMRPYSGNMLPNDQEVHNNRLSRCRRLIENSFGILANTWRILLRRIDLQPEKVRTITLTTCLLHNMLRENREPPTGALLEPVNVAQGFGDVEADGARGANTAMNIRDRFKHYVNSHPILFR